MYDIYLKSKKRQRADYSKNGFYAINSKGEYQKFYNTTDAKEQLKVQSGAISKCIKGIRNTAGGYIFVRAEDIEIEDQDGKKEVDKKKLLEKLKAFEEKAIYAIDEKGKYQKFSDRTEAVEALGVNRACIWACLDGRSKTANGYVFIYAKEVEIKKKDGTIVVDEEKIKERMKLFSS